MWRNQRANLYLSFLAFSWSTHSLKPGLSKLSEGHEIIPFSTLAKIQNTLILPSNVVSEDCQAYDSIERGSSLSFFQITPLQ